MARDVTVFTDDTCTIDGPVRPGPSLIEWAELVRTGALPDVEIADAGVAAELQGAGRRQLPDPAAAELLPRLVLAHDGRRGSPRGVGALAA